MCVLVMWTVLLESAHLPGAWRCQRTMPGAVKYSNCVCNGDYSCNAMPTEVHTSLEKEIPQQKTAQRNGKRFLFTEKLQRKSKEHKCLITLRSYKDITHYQYGVRSPERPHLLNSSLLFPCWCADSTEGKQMLHLSQAAVSLHSYHEKMSLWPPSQNAVLQFQSAWASWEM